MEEDINKLVEGDELDANQFAVDMIISQEDLSTRIDLESQKESLEAVKVTDNELCVAIHQSPVCTVFNLKCEITQEVLNAAAGGIFLYKTPNQAYQLLEDKGLFKLDWAKNQKTKSSLKKTIAFVDEGSGNFDTKKLWPE
nr:reverse transcriptase domain-containing protein [Tanacetum cinerariifolium]